ncbi:hypothetical protein LWI28_017171 [Acer negundo]|uniref:RING-type domain-containing protein n=1 Tax=Acer negundo TaxID=4023 RepID=A0AAD5J6R2_ACENE|nr:hypothetical protein LWI28_017171 [Acer negundo]
MRNYVMVKCSMCKKEGHNMTPCEKNGWEEFRGLKTNKHSDSGASTKSRNTNSSKQSASRSLAKSESDQGARKSKFWRLKFHYILWDRRLIKPKAKMRCNACWRELEGRAISTTCGHLLCTEDASKILSNDGACPICDQVLSKSLLKPVDVNPNDEWINMAMAGVSPQICILNTLLCDLV